MKITKQFKMIKKTKRNKSVENKELKQSQIECENLKNQYLRVLADYKNLENRIEQERIRMTYAIKRSLVESILSVMDIVDKAQIYNKSQEIILVSQALMDSLKDFGVLEVNLLGQPYDPIKAEVIEVLEGKKDGVIAEVTQKAYQINETIIRPGKVKVYRNF